MSLDRAALAADPNLSGDLRDKVLRLFDDGLIAVTSVKEDGTCKLKITPAGRATLWLKKVMEDKSP